METEAGTASADLIAELLLQGRQYSFVQALRLLRLAIPAEKSSTEVDASFSSRIRIRPQLSLSFPTSDVHSVEQTSADPLQYVLTATFLGLYGTSSPLPTFYTEDLLHSNSDGYSAARDFLDVLNTSLYSLLFRCWGKHNFIYNLFEERKDEFIERLYCLLNIGGLEVQGSLIEPYALLRYMGLITLRTHSAEGLRALLADFFNEPTLRIHQFTPRTVNIPVEQSCSLGSACSSLGEDCMVGSVLTDRMCKFTVHISPETYEGCKRFFPSSPEFAKLKNLIDFYISRPLLWDLVITFKPEQIQPLRLGAEEWSRLGWNTWLIGAADAAINPNVMIC
ncbi:MAG: type VI secretion system baseplate subunit TssG [bacterium]